MLFLIFQYRYRMNASMHLFVTLVDVRYIELLIKIACVRT